MKNFKKLFFRKSFYGVRNFALKARLFFFHLKDNPLYMSIQVYTFIRFLLDVHYTCLFRPTRLYGMGCEMLFTFISGWWWNNVHNKCFSKSIMSTIGSASIAKFVISCFCGVASEPSITYILWHLDIEGAATAPQKHKPGLAPPRSKALH